MSSALNQLIAQQQGPNILGSAMQGLAAASQEKTRAQDAQMKQQQLSMAQRQLANADLATAEKHQAQSEQFAANLAYQIKNEKDPARKAQLWTAGREAAANAGMDNSKWPQQYDEKTQAGLDVIFNKVYGGEMVKAELDRKPAGPVNVAAGGTLIDPSTGKVIYQAPEKGLSEYEKRSLAIRERDASKGGADNFRVVGGRLVDISSGKPIDVTPAGAGAASKPLPVPLQRLENDDVKAIQTSSTIQADIGELKRQIDAGEMNLGPLANLGSRARNAAGMSTDSSRKFATLNSSLERLRNESLRLNAGVQTDGDAQRAWNELVSNINDPKLVSERLAEIQMINERGAALRLQAINMRRVNNGVPPLDDTGQFNVDAAIGAGAKPQQKHQVGTIIEHGGKKYRVVGGDPNDPDLEPIE